MKKVLHLANYPLPLLALLFSIFAARCTAGELDLKLLLLTTLTPSGKAEASKTQITKDVSIRLGEPIWIEMVLTNGGAGSPLIIPSLNPAVGCISLYLSQSNNAPERITAARWETRSVYLEPRRLSPGQSISWRTFLFGRLQSSGKHKYLFPTPGTYQLSASYENCVSGLSLHSNTVRVDVDSPIEGWDELQNAGIVDCIEGRSSSLKERSARDATLLDILSRLPVNPYHEWFAGTEGIGRRQ